MSSKNRRRSSQHIPGALESLEQRVFLSAAKVTAAATTTIKPIIHDLIDLASLGREGVKLSRAGATWFDGQTTIGASKNGRKDLQALATSFSAFSLDLSSLESTLATAPLEFTAAAATPLTVALPKPDGSFARFYIVDAPIMEKGLADKYPTIKTFRGVGVDDKYATVRLDYTPLGFHAQVLSPNGDYYIDPYYVSDAKGTYTSYYKHDAKPLPGNTFKEVEDPNEAAPSKTVQSVKDLQVAPYGTQLRTFRAAVAADGEYTAVFGGTVAAGQASIVTAMNRVTGVYETELDIRMTLVANNSSVVYTDPNTDPYSNTTTALSQNTPNLNAVIGSANYDIGHVFTTGSGGVAQLGCVGGSNKGAGTTGLPSPVGDPFYIDYVAHEMGHQFGANHTFNTAGDTGNRSGTHAYEPGSGTSIMAYAGIEGADDLAGHSDAYFHSDSIDAIRTFVTSSIPSVGTTTSTGNTPPTVNAGLDYAIPAGTPFALTASGSDPDGDSLTYDWQERDLGVARFLNAVDNGTSPLFTELAPKTSPTRNLPTLNSILGGFVNTVAGGTTAPAGGQLGAGSNTLTANLAERMYAVARTSNWRVVTRDNRANGGGVASDDMVLTVVNTGAAFAVTSPNTAVSWAGGSTQAVTWTVAGTTAAPINAANVKISLSTDGGLTFPTVLAASTPNDGTENIIVPQLGSTTARIKVEAVGNIFFDIGNANFTVTGSSPTLAAPELVGGDFGFSSTDGITNQNNQSGKKLTFRLHNTVAGAAITLTADNSLTLATGTGTGGDLDLQTSGTLPLSGGTHLITATQTVSGLSESTASPAFTLTIDTTAPQVIANSTSFAFKPTQSLTFTTNETLPQLLGSQITLTNTTTSTVVSTGSFTASYVAATKTGTFNFPTLSDGSYRAVFTGQDTAGNALAATNNSFNFIYVGGAAAHTLVVSKTGGVNTQVVKDGTSTFTATTSTLSQIALDGSSAHDAVTIDYSGGNPLPATANGFRYVGGTGGDNFTVTGAGTFTFNNDPSIDTPGMLLTASAGATVTLSGAGVSTVGAVQANNATINLTATGGRLLVTNAIGATGTGKVDLFDNDLLIHTGAATSNTIAGLIKNAYDFGAWDQGGLFSSAAKNNPNGNTMLGLLTGQEFIDNNGGTFDGQTIGSNDALVKYTYFGDVDFNGAVDSTDYNIIDFGFLTGASGWANGDVDYSGAVDSSDYNNIDFAFVSQTGPL